MQLIIFFNGWGMDENILKKISNNKNYKIVHLNYPYFVEKIDFSKYSKLYVVAWSFGVYYASKFLLENQNLNITSIAINGTPFPIGEYGIPLKLFKLTLNTLSIKNLKLFYKNMGAPRDLFNPNINTEILKDELLHILQNPVKIGYNFDKIFLGRYDRIIPYLRQLKYFKNSTKIITLECEHYPFNILDDWGKIIE